MRKRVFSILLAIVLCVSALPMTAGAVATYREYDLYVERPSVDAGTTYYHGAKYEPLTGAYLGMFAEGDTLLHNWHSSSYSDWYFGNVPQYMGKDHAAYMLYMQYEDEYAIAQYASHYAAAKVLNKAIQVCIEPTNGLDEVQDDAHLQSLAQQASEAEIPLFIRFANEFNDDANAWHKDGPEKYKEKFRLVANAFHTYAPNAVMVWAPNDWPIGSEDAYYPGDEYVDWIGVSSYPIYLSNGTPKHGNTWIDRFYLLYEKYGSRKPVFLTEGAPSATVEYHVEQDVTDAAQYEIRRFYAGIARRCPNLKMVFYWSNNEDYERYVQCSLTTNAAMLAAYKSAIADDYFISEFQTSSDIYYQKVSETTLRGQVEKISCYVNDVNNRVQKASYFINNTYVGEGYFPDYTASLDFSAYVGQSISLRADFFSESGAYLTGRTVQVDVVEPPVYTTSLTSARDNTPSAWASIEVHTAIFRGLVPEQLQGAYRQAITRAEFCALATSLYEQFHGEITERSYFSDTDDVYVQKMAALGVVNGVGDGRFDPHAPITREQAATMLARLADALGYSFPEGSVSFSDADQISDWAQSAVGAVQAAGVMNGVSDSMFSPKTDYTREQSILTIVRTGQYFPWFWYYY